MAFFDTIEETLAKVESFDGEALKPARSIERWQALLAS